MLLGRKVHKFSLSHVPDLHLHSFAQLANRNSGTEPNINVFQPVREEESGRELLGFAGTFKKFKLGCQIQTEDDGAIEDTLNDDDNEDAGTSTGDGEKLGEISSNS